MRISWRFACPECGHRFRLSRSRIRRGLLSGFGYQCPECGTMSRQAVAWLRAVWAWPLAAAAFYADIFLLRHSPCLAHLSHSQPVLVGALAGLSLWPAVVLIRIGMTMAVVAEAEEATRRSWWRSLLWPAITLAVLAAIGIVTRDWRVYAFGLGVGLVMWGVFYLKAGERSSERPEGPDDQGHGDER